MHDLRPGAILLAQPYLLDSNFRRSAVALVDHNPEGSVGFVLNHLLEWRVTDVVNGFPDFDGFLHYGGPVQRDTLHYLHGLGQSLSESIPVSEGVWWGGDFEQLTALIDAGVANAGNVCFYLGYSGWSQFQLAEEEHEGSWVVGDLTGDLVFATPPDQVWRKAMRRLGPTFGVIGSIDEESLN